VIARLGIRARKKGLNDEVQKSKVCKS
jgi:hypothetical protein